MQGLGSRAFMKRCKQNAASWQSAESSLELQRDILWRSCAHRSSLQTETDCNVSAVYLHLWSRCDYLQKPVNVSESDCSSFESDGSCLETGSLPLRGLSHRQWLRVFHIQVNVWWPWLLQIVQSAPKGIASTNTGQGRDEFINTFLINEWIFHISVVTWLGSDWFTFGLSLKRPFEELWKPHDEDLPLNVAEANEQCPFEPHLRIKSQMRDLNSSFFPACTSSIIHYRSLS